MSPSQEVLHSIEGRLRQLAQEIAALESARAELQGDAWPGARPASRRARKPRAAARRKPRAAAVPAAPQHAEEEWLERRTAELSAQSRAAAAA
jgi:hypothetical protein